MASRQAEAKAQVPVDMQYLIDGVLSSLFQHKQFDNVRITVSNSLAEPVITDPLIMETIMISLMENAMRSAIKKHEAEVNIRIYGFSPHNILIEVSDNGLSGPENYREHAFTKRYFDRDTGGAALYYLRLAAEKLGGSVSLVSVENEGTSVSVYLPG